MKYESVHTIRDFYDGVRSGTADFNGLPHYFSCPFDVAVDDYADGFQLFPVTAEFMGRELQHWTIYRTWESKFHRGLVAPETHPGHGGIDAEYDELARWLDGLIGSLEPLSGLQHGIFRPLSDQDSLPAGVLRKLEVGWSPVSA